MSSEQGCNLGGTITGYVGMKNPNIKNALCRRPQQPLAWMSALVSSPQTAERGVRDSPLSGCRGAQQLHHDKLPATRKQ